MTEKRLGFRDQIGDGGRMATPIATDHFPCPIPIRRFDWAAWDDRRGPEWETGYGATEPAAFINFLDQVYENHETTCELVERVCAENELKRSLQVGH